MLGGLRIQSAVYRDSILKWPRVCSDVQGFFIFGQGRSGSTLLGTLLGAHSKIDFRDEILFHRKLFPMAHVNGCASRSTAPFFGFHVKIYQLTEDQRIKRPELFIDRLLSKGWKMIYLRRLNVLRLAVSPLLARDRKLWHIRSDSEGKSKAAVRLDPREVETCVRNRLRFFKMESAILQNCAYLEVIYERDLLDAGRHGDTVGKVTDFLGLEREGTKSHLQKTTSPNLSDDISNLEEIHEHLRHKGLDDEIAAASKD